MSDWQEPWGAAIGRVSADIDDEFGEPIVITPCTARPNFQAEPDPSRPPYAVKGVFRNRSATGLGQHAGVKVDSRRPQVSFDINCLRYPLEQGTRVQRGRKTIGFVFSLGCDMFEVTSVEPDGVSRVVCHLNQLGREDSF